MRSDMHKVIVERPRAGSGRSFRKGDPLRKMARDELPARESMKVRHSDRRHFNENLSPLRRWLRRQVGRPWDHVYSDACKVIKPTSTVKNHVKIHLLEFVHRSVVLLDDLPCTTQSWSGRGYSELYNGGLYVDPASGILRIHRRRHGARTVHPELARLLLEEEMSQTEVARRRLDLAKDERVIRRLLFRKLNGLWHEIEEFEIYQADANGKPARPLRLIPYNPTRQVRIRSRQLNRRELRKAELRNDKAPNLAAV
jgi:hypothetical protein